MATVKPYGLISCQRLNATTAMVGIIYYSAFAGRSGEWESMQREYVVEQIAAGADRALEGKGFMNGFLLPYKSS